MKDPNSRNADATNVSYAWQDPYSAFYRFMHTKAQPPGGFNWGLFSNPEYDKMLDEARATFDPDKRNNFV